MKKKNFFMLIAMLLVLCMGFFIGYLVDKQGDRNSTVSPKGSTAELLLIPINDTVKFDEKFEVVAIPYVELPGFQNLESAGPNATIVPSWSEKFIVFQFNCSRSNYYGSQPHDRIRFEAELELQDGLQPIQKYIELDDFVDAHGDTLLRLVLGNDNSR